MEKFDCKSKEENFTKCEIESPPPHTHNPNGRLLAPGTVTLPIFQLALYHGSGISC